MLLAPLASLVAIAEPLETITTMEAAAESRWLDAVSVAIGRPNDALGCAYLLGYVVECRLKAALGRVKGVLPAANLYTAVIRPLRPLDRHSLTALLDECLRSRPPGLATMPPHLASTWRVRVQAVADGHDVSFRYKSYRVSIVSLHGLYNDVEWIVENISDLWN